MENPKIMHIKIQKNQADENNYIQNITYLTIAGLTVSHYNKFISSNSARALSSPAPGSGSALRFGIPSAAAATMPESLEGTLSLG